MATWSLQLGRTGVIDTITLWVMNAPSAKSGCFFLPLVSFCVVTLGQPPVTCPGSLLHKQARQIIQKIQLLWNLTQHQGVLNSVVLLTSSCHILICFLAKIERQEEQMKQGCQTRVAHHGFASGPLLLSFMFSSFLAKLLGKCGLWWSIKVSLL